ncbi:MAG TPA: RHS repeat-associated core domain-containing protein [Myxococcaceae bacterium]
MKDRAGNLSEVTSTFTVKLEDLPPSPEEVAPPLDETRYTSMAEATAFLYTGPNPIQRDVAPGTIEARRVAVLRGQVKQRDGEPLSGVTITIQGHTQYGHTLTREDGMFDLAVNGGGTLTVQYEKEGFLPVQRQVQAPWKDYALLPEVVLIPLDSQVTPIFANASGYQVARGSVVTDADGTRRATVLFPPGTQAVMLLPNGGTTPLSTLNVRATEYTVGESGPRAMPGELPPTSAYTYAVELSVDEALQAGAHEVQFSQPVALYVDNFLSFPVGDSVPVGYYDRRASAWKASENGRVILIHSIVDGKAQLDVTGDGQPDDAATLAALGLTEAEQQQLANLYPVKHTLWRTPITHFTPWDCNWPFGPPLDATSPGQPVPSSNNPEPGPDCTGGSIIECQSQSLRESLPVVGTPYRLHYASDRVPGRHRTLAIPITGASVPQSLASVVLELSVAGRGFSHAFPPQPNQQHLFTWDGKDAYGRTTVGTQRVVGRIGYIYQLVYHQPADFQRSFAQLSGVPYTTARGSRTVVVWQNFSTLLTGTPDTPASSVGGWRFDVHHRYDVSGQLLYLGDGLRQQARPLDLMISTVAGGGNGSEVTDGMKATDAWLSPISVAVGADGTLYVANRYTHANQVFRVSPEGRLYRFAGTGSSQSTGDGGPALQASLQRAWHVAVGPDGSVFISEECKIRRVLPNNIITTVAGTDTCGIQGEGVGGPATSAQLGPVLSTAVAQDGTLYIADAWSHAVYRLGTDGVLTRVAGTHNGGFLGDNGRAIQARLNYPLGVAVTSDGSVLIADSNNHRVRKVSPDGIIRTIAGNGGDCSGSGPALTTCLRLPWRVATDQAGYVYVASGYSQVARLTPEGLLTIAAGGPRTRQYAERGPAVGVNISAYDVTVAADGTLFVGDTDRGSVRHVQPMLSQSVTSELVVPSPDGTELYVFSYDGRHLRTLHALTRATVREFDYNASGRLVGIREKHGQHTQLERDPAGAPVAIVAPHGQRTLLEADAQGYLARVTNPASEQTVLEHTALGLLTSLKDARGGLHVYTYDETGRLAKDVKPDGQFKQLLRTFIQGGQQVAVQTALGRVNTFKSQELSDGDHLRTTKAPSGLETTTRLRLNGAQEETAPDGTKMTVLPGPHVLFGMHAPLESSRTIRLPSGLTFQASRSQTATLVNGGSPTDFATLTESVTVNGRTFSSTYTANTREVVNSSPLGRKATTWLDADGRPVKMATASLLPIEYSYDASGRLQQMKQGSRVVSWTYDTQGQLETMTDPNSRVASFDYDDAGRMLGQTLPGGRHVGFGYDANGNLTALTPPGRAPHGFAYTAADAEQSYMPPSPLPGVPGVPTLYSYDLDGDITSKTLPDGTRVEVERDSAGRVDAVSTPRTRVDVVYDAQGRLDVMTDPAGASVDFTYDGSMVSQVEWKGAVQGKVGYAYTTDLTPRSLAVNGQAYTYNYDGDGLLSGVGPLNLARRQDNGLLSGTTLTQVTTSQGYNGYGEMETFTASAKSVPVYDLALERDAGGRIIKKTEKVRSTTREWAYSYDGAGRLETVTLDGAPYAAYTYDANGNRLSVTQGGTQRSATYDNQDRLLSYGDTAYSFGPNGDLQQSQRAGEARPRQYQYDGLGNLVAATLPDGTQVSYVIDAQSRQVGKRVNGVLTQGLLYDGQLRVVAELNGSHQVVSRFIYATQENVPDFMVRGTTVYRIISDHLGSPRLILNAADGSVAQQLDYDAWGNVLADSNPGFQPFGFAGGIYDGHTRLTRFGARDYDAETGRWTAKDPLRFAGGDSNLYAYVAGDPVNLIDPTGLCFSDAFLRTFKYNWNTTTDFFFSFPTSLSRSAVGMITAGSMARTTGFISPITAIRSFIGPTMGLARGLPTLGAGGTIASGAAGAVVNGAAVSAALAAGIAAGAALNGLFDGLRDEAPCKDEDDERKCQAN